jgi:Lrp/AsnC family transcriptional regulator
MHLDRTNCIILNLLQENCRMSLTDIAKEVDLSVDAVKKRVDKLMASNIFHPKVQMRPRYFGFDIVVDVKVKLHNHKEGDHQRFINHLLKQPRVVEVIAVSGAYDYTVVFIAKDTLEVGDISQGIRNEFSGIIDQWVESLTTKVYRFEKYDLLKIMGLEGR